MAGWSAIAGPCDGVRCDMAMLVLPDDVRMGLGHPGMSGRVTICKRADDTWTSLPGRLHLIADKT